MEENKPLNPNFIQPVLILGAGASALTLGRMLKEARLSCLFIEKSRGLGGRIATRRFEDSFWNHGISEITLNDFPSTFPEPWRSFAPSSLEPATQFAKHLADSLDILKGVKIIHLDYDSASSCWKARSEEGQTFKARSFVSTAPLPQTCDLLQASGMYEALDPQKTLSQVRYFKQLIFLTRATQVGAQLPIFKKICVSKNNFISFQLDFSESEYLFEKEDAEIEAKIKVELEKNGWSFSHFEIKRWRYSQCENPMNEAFFESPSPCLFYSAGDGFCGGGLKGAFQSALELSEALIKRAPHLKSF